MIAVTAQGFIKSFDPEELSSTGLEDVFDPVVVSSPGEPPVTYRLHFC